MATGVQFISQPTNMDYLIPSVRLQFGDLTGDTYTDTIVRTSLTYAVDFLQKRWANKYQTYRSEMLVSYLDTSALVNTADGQAYIPSGLAVGSVFRNPYITFMQTSPPVIETQDEQAIILAAVYLLRKSQVSSNAGEFVSWTTEDIRWSNLGYERTLARLLEQDKLALDDYFKKNIARPQRADFLAQAIPGLE